MLAIRITKPAQDLRPSSRKCDSQNSKLPQPQPLLFLARLRPVTESGDCLSTLNPQLSTLDPSQNQHRVAVAVEAVLFVDRFAIGTLDQLAAGEVSTSTNSVVRGK